MKNENASKMCIRTYQNNQLVKAYIDKSAKYKGYMPKYKVCKVIEESEGDSLEFKLELYSSVKRTQEGNFLLVNKLSNGSLKAWYVNQSYNVLRGVIDAESEIEFSDSWESNWEIIPKVNIEGTFRVSNLKCPRGLSMARFRNHCTVPSDSFLEIYFANGGEVDGGGGSGPVWGFYPARLAGLEEKGIDPSLLGRVFSIIGRIDYSHDDYILEMVRLGLEPRTRKEYGRNCCGISRRILLEKFGVSHNKGVITLGYMSIEKFVRLLLGNATVANKELIESAFDPYEWDTFISREACIAQLAHANGLMKYWINCEVKIRNRRLYRNKVQEVRRKKGSYKLKSKKAIEFCFRTNKPIFIGHIDKKVWVNCSHQTTSIGDVCYMADGIDFSFRGQITGQKRRNTYWSQYDFFFTQAKKLKGYWVARELSLKTNKDVFFIWENSFSDHIEANSLREGLELIQKRIKKQSLILCLNDVRNDRAGTAGYCLAGTKSFAQARMPFMYRLISQYNNWSDIPEEIMSLEFHLASKSIFNGFRNPVS